MKKILFVCMGNICRSPMAEGITRKVFEEYGIDAELDSAGTIAYHSGESPDFRARAEVKKHGIDISKLRARQINQSDFEYFDHIFTMDSENYSNVIANAPDEYKHKVEMMMNLSHRGENISVPDPYYGGDEGFRRVYMMLEGAAIELASRIKNNKI